MTNAFLTKYDQHIAGILNEIYNESSACKILIELRWSQYGDNTIFCQNYSNEIMNYTLPKKLCSVCSQKKIEARKGKP